MDNPIKKYSCVEKSGLCCCEVEGVAYQKNMTESVPYDQAYFDKYMRYEKSPIGRNLNRARVDAVKSWANNLPILDVGIGCGTFIKYAQAKNLNLCGYDINPVGIAWLKRRGIYENPYTGKRKIACFTFWDSLEHIPEPQKLLEKIPLGSFVFISIPVFENLESILRSKHYRPDEHYYYFTTMGLMKYLRGFSLEFTQKYNFEKECGREGIETFLFEKTIIKNKKSNLLHDFFRREMQANQSLVEMIKCSC